MDYESVKDTIVGYKKNFTEITANDLPVRFSKKRSPAAGAYGSGREAAANSVPDTGRHADHGGVGQGERRASGEASWRG